MEADLHQTRAQCQACNEIVPSHAKEPLADPPMPEFTFQYTVTNLCDIRGNTFLIFADRYTSWVEAAVIKDPTSKKVCDKLQSWFCTYRAPVELASDGGPPFQSYDYSLFLQNWGIRRHLSSAYYPQSNGRAEAAVKTAKHILMGNTDTAGHINYDQSAHAFMMHQNTPLQDVGISPAEMLFGKPIKDHLPSPQDQLAAWLQWKEIHELWEKAMAKCHAKSAEYYNKHTQVLPPLTPGDRVLLQNQMGNHPNCWEKTGLIVETLGNRLCQIKVDGSNYITLRNRCFLRKITPFAPSTRPLPQIPPTMPELLPLQQEKTDFMPQEVPTRVTQSPPMLPEKTSPAEMDTQVETTTEPISHTLPPSPLSATPPSPAVIAKPSETPPVQRSQRPRSPWRNLSPVMQGQRHDYVEQ